MNADKGYFLQLIIKLKSVLNIARRLQKYILNVNKKLKVSLILIAIILFHIISNYIWLKYDTTYLKHDAHQHHLLSLAVFYEIKNNVIPLLSNVFDRVIYSRWHGVFVGFITAPFYLIFGAEQDTGVMVNSTIFFTILIFSVYGVGKTIFNKKTGLLSAFIVSMYPIIFNQLRIYMLDLPLAAMVSLSIFLLIKTKYFSNKNYSILFAIFFGFGMLTKFNFVGFIIGPLFFILFKAFTKYQGHRKIIFYNICVALCINIILLFSFIKLKFWEIVSRFYGCSWLNPIFLSGHKSSSSLIFNWLLTGFEYIVWSLKEMMSNILSFFFFVVFFVSLISFFRKKVEYKNILFLWILLPLIFLSLLFHYPNFDRYLMPVLPAIAIISGGGITGIKFFTLKIAIIILVVFLGCFQYFAISYNCSFLPQKIELPLPAHILGLKNKYFGRLVLFHRDIELRFRNRKDRFSFPSQIQWPSEDIIKEILKNIKSPYPKVDIFFIDSIPEIYETIRYITFLKEFPITTYTNSLDEEELYKRVSPVLFLIDNADYIAVLKDADPYTLQNEAAFIRQKITGSRDYFFKKTINDCTLLKKFELPTGNHLLLFKKKKDYIKLEKLLTDLYFRDGRWQWYYKGIAVAKDGFGSSFKFKGRVYNTLQAQWSIEPISESKIIAKGNWQDVPIIQEWEFNILSDKEIMASMRIICIDEVEIQDMSFFLLLSHFYRKWETSEKKGYFSRKNILRYTDIYLPESTRWLTISSHRKNIFPNITFIPVSQQFKISPIIGYQKNFRKVKFEISKYDYYKFSLSPGTYDCISVKILLEHKPYKI